MTVQLAMSHSDGKGIELTTISSPENVFEVLKAIFVGLDEDQEHLVLLILNYSHDLVGFKVLASGTQSSVVVDTKILFRNALLLGAHAVILAHNHPTGNIKPSDADIGITEQIVAAGKIVGVNLIDHVIFQPSKYYSIRQALPHLFGDIQ